ncbi:MAG TPA: hypothetical protein DCL77_14670 [Prolixibacteraceae bacterium]|jgi:hypothetical protein|nr:hypothetical protein [Prolixibacteraceae bacterium]
MKIKVFARVGCTFHLDCEPELNAILKALQAQVETIPFVDGETYIPESEDMITDENDNPIFEEWDLDEPTIEPSYKAPAPKYFLLGEDLCNAAFSNNDWDEFIEEIKSCGIKVRLYKWESNDVSELLSELDGWNKHALITEEQYIQLLEEF